MAALVHRIWTGDGLGARTTRGALKPFALAYRAALAVRRTLYAQRVLQSHDLALPAISIGNVTVGGTGKTPMAAWFAAQLAQRGGRPAVVLRGYGDDEPLVHAALNPTIPVVVGARRVAAVERAQAQGADVAVLDDAFQHWSARRLADVVLVSADQWDGTQRLLPAGPWREPISALRRATLIVATRKAASVDRLDEVWRELRRRVPQVPCAAVLLAPASLVEAHQADSRPLSTLTGTDVLAIAGVADPASFDAQLRSLGARVTLRAFRDHHRFTVADAKALAEAGAHVDLVVCTLKDAVKLAPLWPRGGAALWYLSQDVILERGRPEIDRIIAEVLGARARYNRKPASPIA